MINMNEIEKALITNGLIDGFLIGIFAWIHANFPQGALPLSAGFLAISAALALNSYKEAASSFVILHTIPVAVFMYCAIELLLGREIPFTELTFAVTALFTMALGFLLTTVVKRIGVLLGVGAALTTITGWLSGVWDFFTALTLTDITIIFFSMVVGYILIDQIVSRLEI